MSIVTKYVYFSNVNIIIKSFLSFTLSPFLLCVTSIYFPTNIDSIPCTHPAICIEYLNGIKCGTCLSHRWVLYGLRIILYVRCAHRKPWKSYSKQRKKTFFSYKQWHSSALQCSAAAAIAVATALFVCFERHDDFVYLFPWTSRQLVYSRVIGSHCRCVLRAKNTTTRERVENTQTRRIHICK